MTTKKRKLTKAEMRDRRDNLGFGMSVLSLGIGVTSLVLALNGRPDPEGMALASRVSEMTGMSEGEAYMTMCGPGWEGLTGDVDRRTAKRLRTWRRGMGR